MVRTGKQPEALNADPSQLSPFPRPTPPLSKGHQALPPQEVRPECVFGYDIIFGEGILDFSIVSSEKKF